MARPTKRSCLACLTKKRLILLAREFELDIVQAEPKDAFIEVVAHSKAASFARVLQALPVTELRHVLRVHELPVSGNKDTLIARIRGEDQPDEPPAPQQTSLLDETADELAAVFARAQPSLAGIVPMLDRAELAAVLRRLEEHHGVHVDLSHVSGLRGLTDAIVATCELPVFLSELSREQLTRVCKRYALEPEGRSHEAMLRAILAAAAGLTEAEAQALERGHEPAAEPKPTAEPEPTAEPAAEPTPAESKPKPAPSPDDAVARYRAALDALPRGVLHRVEPLFDPGELPKPGDLVRARQRQYLVSEVLRPEDPAPNPKTGLRPATLVKLVCLDDDAQGRELDVFWELELGAERIDPTRSGLGRIQSFDPAPRFAAYYHALQWNCVTTATSPANERVQAPFRAGISVMQHQLVPLQRVLALPRANLFIADDVGLGKTIEAGLILQELLLRQRLDLIIIVCPASICLQWQGEMERRFGLRFDIVSREHFARVRRERGAGTNPWACGRRFIVSYQTLRRPEYQEKLRAALGDRKAKSMLVFDEAHTVAPASNQQRDAVDSKLTKLARYLAPRFENRLFLSATPHNGHSNSFTALLELLDGTRFTRGISPADNRAALGEVMVRRLKRDLIGTSTLSFPERKLVELRLVDEDGAWHQRRVVADEAGEELELGEAAALGEVRSAELELSQLLSEYRQLCAPTAKRDQRVFIGLQKRLLSSCAAFEHTLAVHLGKIGKGQTGARILAALPDDEPGDLPQGDAPSDEVHGEELDDEVEAQVAGGAGLPSTPSVRARGEQLLARMETLARGARSRPEAKLLGVLAWIREHQCPAAGRQWLPTPTKASRAWTDTRLIIFTEYAHTASYIIKMLRAALAETEGEHERVAYFHGAMSDDQRRELQANFNAHPAKHPVRILVATDAAREGVNLQAHCADLIHYDIPWNPGRLEQRNGRIDRTLQPSPEVRCMYFAHPQRKEDRVLEVVVRKVGRIQRELGSLSAVVLERIEATLEDHGIEADTQQRLDLGERDQTGDEARRTVEREVESVRPSAARLREEINAAADCYARSRAFFAPDADGLRETLSMALALAGADNEGRIERCEDARDPAHPDEPTHYRLPPLPEDWRRTLDTLRPPKPKDQSYWEWRRDNPPKPVVFESLTRMTDEVIQLHLEHPVVRRALTRFTAQGYAAHDLHRATLVRYEGTHARAVLVARLSLFGAGASRLHDGLLHLVAELRDEGPATPLTRERDIDETLTQLRAGLSTSPSAWTPAKAFVEQHRARVEGDVAVLWPELAALAHQEARELSRRLDDRGAREAEQLREILRAQLAKIDASLAKAADDSTRQRRLDRDHLKKRRRSLSKELELEPERLRRHYVVASRRVEAVGLIYLIPKTR